MRGVVYAVNRQCNRLIVLTAAGDYSFIQATDLERLEVGDAVQWHHSRITGASPALINVSRGTQYPVVSVEHGLEADHVGLYLFSGPGQTTPERPVTRSGPTAESQT